MIGQKTTAMLYLHGWSSSQWTIHSAAEPGMIGAPHAILTRILMERPDLCPLPQHPPAQEVFDMLKAVDPDLTERQFPVLLGMEPTAAVRLLDENKDRSPIANTMLLLIHNAMQGCTNANERRQVYDFLREKAEEEARSRGMDERRMWTRGGWRKHLRKKKELACEA